MNFSKTQLFALLFIVIMLASTIAIALLSRGDNSTPTDTNQPDQPLDNQSQTTLSYTAQAPATVFKSLNRLIFFGATKEPDISKIDAKLITLSGIKSDGFKSYFKNDPDTGGLLYVAEFGFDPQKTTADQLLQSAGQTNLFSSQPFSYAQALVSVSKTVVFHNADLDVNREYDFLDPLIVAYVSTETQPNDAITIQLDATFTGAKMSNLVSSELENPATSPQMRQANRLVSLDQLEPILTFSADTNYSLQLEPAVLKPKIEKISNVVSAQVFFVPTQPFKILFFFQDNQTRQDVNSFFFAYSKIKSFQIADDPAGFAVTLDFNASSDVETVKTDVRAFAKTKNWTEGQSFSFESWVFRLSGRLDTATVDLNQTATAFSGVLNIKDPVTLYQLAKTNVTIIDEDQLDPSKGSYVLDQNTMAIQVFPGKKISEPVAVLIKFVTIRSKIVQVLSATELSAVSNQSGNPDENPFLQ